MLFVILIGIAALATVVVSGIAYHRAPTRITCPTCAGATSSVRPPGVLGRTPGVTWRWCAACGWQGVGRNGPDWRPGRKVAHDSGFHWGRERLPEDFGFRWRPRPEGDAPAPAEPPHHPSGFRFGSSSSATSGHGKDAPGDAGAQPPSRGRWSRPVRPDTEGPEDGFRWKQSG